MWPGGHGVDETWISGGAPTAFALIIDVVTMETAILLVEITNALKHPGKKQVVFKNNPDS